MPQTSLLRQQANGRRKRGGWGGLGRPTFSVTVSKFELWTLNNAVQFLLRIHNSFLSDRAGGPCLADPAIAGPTFSLRWCCRPFACKRETRISATHICARTNLSSSVKADCERGSHTFLTGVARNKIQSYKILTGFRAPLLRSVPRVYLKPRMLIDTNPHAFGREANFVTMPRR